MTTDKIHCHCARMDGRRDSDVVNVANPCAQLRSFGYLDILRESRWIKSSISGRMTVSLNHGIDYEGHKGDRDTFHGTIPACLRQMKKIT